MQQISKQLKVIFSIFALIALMSLNVSTANATYGISAVKFSKDNLKAGDTLIINFQLSYATSKTDKYFINVMFNSIRNSFNATANLNSGDYAEGNWQAEVKIPGDIFSSEFEVTFSPVPNNSKSKFNFSTDRAIRIYIQGKNTPVAPIIEVFNIKAGKPTYLAGETVEVSFETRIIYGVPNEETTNPLVALFDLRFGNFIKSNIKPYKAIVAKGSYSTGKWTAEYPIASDLLSGQAVIHILTPQGFDKPEQRTKGDIFEIKSLVNEIKILNAKLDNETYLNTDSINVSFQTFSLNNSLNQANKPYIIISDIEYSDLSTEMEAVLESGSLDNGVWRSKFLIPKELKPGTYYVAFYNNNQTIRELGPSFQLRINPNLDLSLGSQSPVVQSVGKITYKSSSFSPLPVQVSSLTDAICGLQDSNVQLKSVGKCIISAEVKGDDYWGTSIVQKAIEIVKNPEKTLKCIKGKTVRIIKSQAPKCPAGFKISK